jgi:hypothetical protein
MVAKTRRASAYGQFRRRMLAIFGQGDCCIACRPIYRRDRSNDACVYDNVRPTSPEEIADVIAAVREAGLNPDLFIPQHGLDTGAPFRKLHGGGYLLCCHTLVSFLKKVRQALKPS